MASQPRRPWLGRTYFSSLLSSHQSLSTTALRHYQGAWYTCWVHILYCSNFGKVLKRTLPKALLKVDQNHDSLLMTEDATVEDNSMEKSPWKARSNLAS
jgi:hypothetical protein